ncbi:MAG: redoxin domain-containing protein [Bacteroidota bacterium]|nr:redoxin domain-containing protein [Bacteroidota bacterium]
MTSATMGNRMKFYLIVLFCMFLLNTGLRAQGINIKIHLRGVYNSKISLLPMTGTNALKPLVEKEGIKNEEVAVISIPEDRLPGEFVLRFDYKQKESSNPYPSEKRIVAYNQDLELWVSPPYANNQDSTYFQKDERENALIAKFFKESSKRKEQLGLLQNFLMNYDEPHSDFYKRGIHEYEKRRVEYNQWLEMQINQNKGTFVSSSFRFQYVPKVDWKGSETDRKWSLVAHYFDGMDFKDPLLIKTTGIKDWLNQYVNIYGTFSTTVALRDSLFTLAGQRAITHACLGHPLVYGWVVDYFYNGYESFNIAAGMKMLKPYLDDPNCLTSKRQAIEKRLQGMETLTVGTLAPDFISQDDKGNTIRFHDYKENCRYKLVFFWSADCNHCKELVGKLYPLCEQWKNKNLMDVFAISVDETKTEIPIWEKTKGLYPLWKHIRAKGGINSKEASAYFILSTPVMILVDSQTNKIIALPENIEQLSKAIGE